MWKLGCHERPVWWGEKSGGHQETAQGGRALFTLSEPQTYVYYTSRPILPKLHLGYTWPRWLLPCERPRKRPTQERKKRKNNECGANTYMTCTSNPPYRLGTDYLSAFSYREIKAYARSYPEPCMFGLQRTPHPITSTAFDPSTATRPVLNHR